MTGDFTDQRARLRHHGDVDAAPGLADFAVNVTRDRPPPWLLAALTAELADLGRYPSAELDLAARQAVADRHGLASADEVLVLAGAAEGFALLPALRPRLAAVVHPSFTEPEVALADAGVPVRRVLLRPDDGYALHPADVPADADLVVLGNPTNPTSVLHPADTVRALARPGRVLVVDEAFMDAVPGEPASVAAARLPGLIVLRSLTKTWALAGLRAGYAIAAPDLLAQLGRHRPQWPVSNLVLAAVRACAAPIAVAEAHQAAVDLTRHREWLVARLAALPGIEVHQPAAGPFLLLRVPDGSALRQALRARGVAVRRADTFPGLTADHLRIAVRSPERCAPLLAALHAELAEGIPA